MCIFDFLVCPIISELVLYVTLLRLIQTTAFGNTCTVQSCLQISCHC